MIAYQLRPPVEAFGWRMETLEDAAYVVRKYAIETDDGAARKLVRFMRDAETMQDAGIAEGRLRAWALATTAAIGRGGLATKLGPDDAAEAVSDPPHATGTRSAYARSPDGTRN